MSMKPEEKRIRDTKIGQPTVKTGAEPIKNEEGKGRTVTPGKIDLGKFGKIANLFSDQASKPVIDRKKEVADAVPKKRTEAKKAVPIEKQVVAKEPKSATEKPKPRGVPQKPAEGKQESVQVPKQREQSRTLDIQSKLEPQQQKLAVAQPKAAQKQQQAKQLGPVIPEPVRFEFLNGENASHVTDLAKNYLFHSRENPKEMTLFDRFRNWLSQILIDISGKSSSDGLTELVASKLEGDYNVKVDQKELKTWLNRKKNSNDPNERQEAKSVIAYALGINDKGAEDWLNRL